MNRSTHLTMLVSITESCAEEPRVTFSAPGLSLQERIWTTLQENQISTTPATLYGEAFMLNAVPLLFAS